MKLPLFLFATFLSTTLLVDAQDGASFEPLDSATKQRCLKTLRAGLKSDEFWPSIHAAEGLTLAGHGDEVIAYLEPRLPAEKDDQHRCGISREMVRAGKKKYVSVMAGILSGEDPHGHIHAAESLYKVFEIGDLVAMEKAFAKEGVIKLHLMAAGALVRHNQSPEAYAAIRAALAGDNPEGIQIGAWLLARVGDKSDIEPLRARLPDVADDPIITVYIEHALATLGDPAGLKAMKQNLKSDDPAIRTHAATFAGDAKAFSLRDELIKLLDDPHPDATYRAAQTLLQLDAVSK